MLNGRLRGLKITACCGKTANEKSIILYKPPNWRLFLCCCEDTKQALSQVNPQYIKSDEPLDVTYDIIPYYQIESAELDEMWSFVQSKKNQRWLWLAVNHENGDILAYVFGKRKDKVFNKFQKLLEPLGINMFYTDNWGSYDNISEEHHIVGKKNTQTIERKNLTLKTRIKRLARKTICFSKSKFMHDTVIGLLINILEFDWDVYWFCQQI